ncbi:branched-chain amino acid transport system II carrier protein [Paenibacillus sp. ACRRX]|uniref:branched-chain amino acid transport system II carrier protein n=1 Tax=Paenibacillus sp. ACRRX TaxID=2918206 RepID=UPI001EF5FA8A|nr:branched-chain amino acid transport system II carrier protein [Paenibacillus sp. ACRRX]MCG7407192.1 branched-chain amino acid transport system II carrier protein [Paenibacillus sp. ACRRX]
MKGISNKNVFFIGLMLFSLFFGAGNLIFPPILGQQAGEHFIPAIAGFIFTGVGLPLLAVIAIALTGRDMQYLASRVSPKFGIFFAIVVYVSLGPSMGIPRVANVSYEMGFSTFLGTDLATNHWPLFLYTFLFFVLVFWLSLNPSKLVGTIGSILTPLLLLSIAALFIAAMLFPLGESGPALNEYVDSPGIKGFMEGYLTLDAIAALAFGIIVINSIRDQGVEDKKMITKATIQAGVIAGIGLSLVYAALGYMGVTSVSLGYANNGGQLLTLVVQQLFGDSGLILLAVIVTLACLTTCIGLVSACSQYFASLQTRVSYGWVTFGICLLGLIVANLGLDTILSISKPILLIIYPVSITLILLSFLHKWFRGIPAVYGGALLGAALISLFDGLKAAKISIDFAVPYLEHIPMYKQGVGWVIPAIVGACIGYVWGRINSKHSQATGK